MSQGAPKRITRRQAKAQINTFGRPLVIYIIIFTLLNYGTSFLHETFPDFFATYDFDMVMIGIAMISTLLVTLIILLLAKESLKLDIKDYLGKPRISGGRMLAFVCIGIGIEMLTTSVSSLFYFFFHTNSQIYEYLGSFNTTSNIVKNVLYFVDFILLKPICDEMIFRGVIQRQLGHYGRYFGVLGSAFLFAMAQLNLIDAIPAFFVGWFLSLLTMNYHSIRPGIVVHISLSLFLWLFNVIPAQFLWITVVILGMVYIVSAFFIFQKHNTQNFVRYGATEWKLWKILLSSGTVILVILLFIVNVVLSFL